MEFKTTFWNDFTIAEHFGEIGINDTFLRVRDEWKTNCRYWTELVIVLNHKIWEHWEKGNEKLARIYDKLWRIAEDYALNHFQGEELEYFVNTTD